MNSLVSRYVSSSPISESSGRDPGSSLESQRSPDPRESARWIAEIADAIQYLDAKGVVYRDLNPSAIVIGKDGSARLANLATGCALKENHHPSTFSARRYASPEEVRGEGNPTSAARSTAWVLFSMRC